MILSNRNLLITGVGIGLVVMLTRLAYGSAQHKRHHSESALDDALADSFPASDPPATQDFAVPANRA